ncbi:sensor histidine kinase [Falsibacillus albus]|uniref:histidine kinase n=1 Tax=Falsibacillus albus TaxID=2478915 RepID=A0A3L7K0K7_9BACI|nr:HAMP domain-containing sensor histidine kinase [Falsibacillus albus]RLQ96598.1 sensor histidine kinase [Falsibacillus albus]
MLKEMLLNFFLILIPLYFYPFILKSDSLRKRQVFLGIICGLISIVCMKFPIVAGEGFIWDFRWIAFLISILFGGAIGGGFTGIILVLFRFSLGSLLSSLNVLIVAIALFVFFLPKYKKFQFEMSSRKLFLSMIYSAVTFVFVILAIAFQFWYEGNLIVFSQVGAFVLTLMGLSYLVAMSAFCLITENMNSFYKLREAFHQAEKSNVLHELSALMSYDIKNSLSNMKEKLYAGQKETNPNGILDDLAHIEDVIDKYSEYRRSQLNMEEELNIHTEINEVMKLLLPYSKTKRVQLNFTITPGLMIYGDRLKFKQAILNIIKNAIDVTPRGGEVLIKAEDAKKDVVIRIKDKGLGLSQEQLREIKYFLNHLHGNTVGRGLLVTLKLLEAMEGNIQFDSEIGKGTEVTVKLRKHDKNSVTENVKWKFRKDAAAGSK